MIVKGKDVIGLPIITIDSGAVIHTVKEISYDPRQQRITSLITDFGGIFKAAKAIHINDVHRIGEDAVIIQDAAAVVKIKQLEQAAKEVASSKKYLVRNNVVTAEGKQLGSITDIMFDSETGMVDGMEVSQGGLMTMTSGRKRITPADIITVGADAIIVSAYTEELLEAQAEQQGLQGAVNDIKGKADAAIEKAKETTAEVTRDLKGEESAVIPRKRRIPAKTRRKARSAISAKTL